MNEALIQALQNPSLYPHVIEKFEVIQTHLSWVILTGKFAYKIKKPLNLGFQDFTTLAKRKYYCELELTLNQSLAPDLYQAVIPITGTMQNPSLNEKGNIIEYAIKMHQFPQKQLLSHLLKTKLLNKQIIYEVSNKIAHFHLKTSICHENNFADPDRVFAPMQDNFTVLKSYQTDKQPIETIEAWTISQYHLLKPLLIARKAQGFIRACHGDIHLGNMVLFNNKLCIFDCIEFNEHFRWIDVINDISFLAMDLTCAKKAPLANLFINKYLEYTNDYLGIQLLRFYECYRAMVRAKISFLQLKQLQAQEGLAPKLKQDLSNFLQFAFSLTRPPDLSLTITYGLSGSGKSLYTENLMMQQNAIRLRSDVIRKHLNNLSPFAPTPDDKKPLLYANETTKTLYLALQSMARELLLAKWPVIIDATCLTKWQRQLFFEVAKTCQVPFKILVFSESFAVLKQRIQSRTRSNEPSDADEQVLELQLAALEPLSKTEASYATIISAQEIAKCRHDWQ
ncbi:MAG: AAA family ATPase [Proteobacteria bacterium]|nr:AAA family ATPase [Pseudomonadota bacterium]